MARYDPETGEKLRFDPETGEQLPLTGRVDPAPSYALAPPPAPVFEQPPVSGKRKALVPLLVAVMVLMVTGGAVLAATLGGKEKAGADSKAAAAAAIEECKAELGDYVASLQALDTQLDVGLNVSDYSEIVRGIALEQAGVDAESLEGDCADAKSSADLAYMLYSAQASAWDDCIWDDYCDPDDLDLAASWELASTNVEDAVAAMNGESTGNDL